MTLIPWNTASGNAGQVVREPGFPWGQIVSHFLSLDGILIGVAFTSKMPTK
jgi:hypothetical protein